MPSQKVLTAFLFFYCLQNIEKFLKLLNAFLMEILKTEFLANRFCESFVKRSFV